MPKYTLTGDIIQAGSVVVEAATKEEAIAKAEAGDFRVNETHKPYAFTFDGDDDHISVED